MKNHFIILISFFTFFTLFTEQAFSQSKETMRAKAGEKVLLITHKVKAASKANYEEWIEKYMFGIILNDKDPTIQEQYLKTRFLTPNRQNKDGTWTYVFFMDPWVEDGNYNFVPMLEKEYAKEKAQQLFDDFLSYLAVPFEVTTLVQSGH